MSTEWCMEERCRHRHWRSGSMPTHRRGEDCPPTIRERVARAWHEGSDHAADGAGFGSPTCNCQQVADRMMPLLAEAWTAGEQAGLRRADWEYGASPNFPKPNPYEGDRHVDQ